MPAPLLSRDEMLDRLLDTFRTRGYDGASLSDLSAATGLGRSSLYHYFPGGKQEMAAAVLERATAWLERRALAPLRQEGSPESRLRRMIRALDEFYEHGQKACLLGNLVVGEARPLFQTALQQAFTAWIQGLADLLAEAGIPGRMARERAEEAVLKIQGSLVLAGGLNTPQPFRRVLQRLPAELLAPVA